MVEDTYQQPPAASLLSKTRIVSNTFSCANASIAMAPPGPSPMTATRLTPISRDECRIDGSLYVVRMPDHCLVLKIEATRLVEIRATLGDPVFRRRHPTIGMVP